MYPASSILFDWQVAKLLQLSIPQQRGAPTTSRAPGQGVGRFLLPHAECEFALEAAIDALEVNSPHVSRLFCTCCCWH